MLRERVLNINWRLAAVHILVNALALGLTFLILPGLEIIHENKILTLLASGLIFGLLNAFIRPILQFALFNFLFATFGLVLVVINFILLFILGELLQGWFQSNGLLTLLLAAVLIGLFGVIFDNLLGLTPPIVETYQPQSGSQSLGRVIEERFVESLEDEPATKAPVITAVEENSQ